MKLFKKTIIVSLMAVMILGLTGCNRQIIDTTYSYDRAIMELPNGEVVSGSVDSWKDYDDGDQIQVVIDDVTYLVHSSKIVLIND